MPGVRPAACAALQPGLETQSTYPGGSLPAAFLMTEAGVWGRLYLAPTSLPCQTVVATGRAGAFAIAELRT